MLVMADTSFFKIFIYTCGHNEKCARELAVNCAIGKTLEGLFNKSDILYKNLGLKNFSICIDAQLRKVVYLSVPDWDVMLTGKNKLGLWPFLIFYKQLLTEKFWRNYWLL